MFDTPIPDIPNFENYGWKLIDNKPQPIMTNDSLIPSDLVELLFVRLIARALIARTAL